MPSRLTTNVKSSSSESRASFSRDGMRLYCGSTRANAELGGSGRIFWCRPAPGRRRRRSLEETAAWTGWRPQTSSKAGTRWPRSSSPSSSRRSTATSWARELMRPHWISRPRGWVGPTATSRPSSSPVANCTSRGMQSSYSGELARLVDERLKPHFRSISFVGGASLRGAGLGPGGT